MDFEYDMGEPEIRAQIQLLKSHIERKSVLTFELNQMKISTSYRNSTGRRDIVDLQHQNKLLNRRLSAVRYMSETLKSINLKEVNKETLSDLLAYTQEVEPKLEISRDVFSLNFDLDTSVQELKEVHTTLSQIYEEKMLQFKENQSKIQDFTTTFCQYKKLFRETQDYSSKILKFETEIQELSNKKSKVTNSKRESVEKIKIFQQLSSHAMQFRSKLLLKEELIKNFKSAEKVLDDLNFKVKRKQGEVEEAKKNRVESLKSTARSEVELEELRKITKKLEMRIEELCQEKNQIVIQGVGSLSQESRGESETVVFPNILSGFKRIHLKNTFLYEENLKLKERLSNFK